MLLEKFNPIIPAEDDGFAIGRSSSWTLRKNQLIRHYLQVFTGTMKRKFNYMVYLDMNSGSGISRLENGTITIGSPVIALSNPDRFSKYIFTDKSKDHADALKIRIMKYCRDENSLVFHGDPNQLIERLIYYIPDSSKRYKVSTLCLIDASSLDMDFDTIRILSEIGVNFLVIFGLPWDSPDQYRICIEEQRELLNSFLGKPWSHYKNGLKIGNNELFFRNLVKFYHQNLMELGYMVKGSFHKIESSSSDIPVFFCGYYSNTTGTRKIHTEVIKRLEAQVKLFE